MHPSTVRQSFISFRMCRFPRMLQPETKVNRFSLIGKSASVQIFDCGSLQQ